MFLFFEVGYVSSLESTFNDSTHFAKVTQFPIFVAESGIFLYFLWLQSHPPNEKISNKNSPQKGGPRVSQKHPHLRVAIHPLLKDSCLFGTAGLTTTGRKSLAPLKKWWVGIWYFFGGGGKIVTFSGKSWTTWGFVRLKVELITEFWNGNITHRK